MPRDFHVEELARQARAPVLTGRFIGPDPTAGRAPRCLDWCREIEDGPIAHDVEPTLGRRRAQWTPEGDDLLGWATLLATAPVLLVGALIGLAWFAA